MELQIIEDILESEGTHQNKESRRSPPPKPHLSLQLGILEEQARRSVILTVQWRGCKGRGGMYRTARRAFT